MEVFTLKPFSLIFGLCIGSFLNAVIYRLPREISLSASRSHCPKCNKLIYWYENIPVFSWIFLRGKCSGCKSKISIEYPIVELGVGLFSLSLTPAYFERSLVIEYFFEFSVFSIFVCHFLIDLRHKILPNSLNLLLALILFSKIIYQESYTHWLIGGSIGIFFPLAVTYGFYLLKGEVGLGGGDIKLYGALGLFFGPLGIMQNIFLSCFLGAIIGGGLIVFKFIDRKTPVPFGPFIIIVASSQIFFPDNFRWFLENTLNMNV